MQIRARRPGGDPLEAIAGPIARVHAEAAVEVGVVLRRHLAAAAPVLVADAEEGNLPGVRAAVGLAELREVAVALERHVLDPVGHLLGRAAAHVGRDVGLGADPLAEVEELVGAEAVVLDDASPVDVDPAASRLRGADAVLPVVLVGEAAARPAQVGDLDLAQRLDDVVSNAVSVGDRRCGPDPQPVVDAAAEMLGEVAVDVPADHRTRLPGADRQRGVPRLLREGDIRDGQQDQQPRQAGRFREDQSLHRPDSLRRICSMPARSVLTRGEARRRRPPASEW